MSILESKLFPKSARLALDFMPCGVHACDPYGTVTYCNPQAERLLGFTHVEQIGRPLWYFLSSKTARDTLRCYVRFLCVSGVEPTACVGKWQTKVGQPRVMEIHPTPIQESSGAIAGIVSTLRERSGVSRCIDLDADIVVVIGTDGAVMMINRSGCDLLQREENQIIGKSWFDHFVPASHRAVDWRHFRAMLATGEVVVEPFTSKVSLDEDESQFVSWRSHRLQGPSGQPVGVLFMGNRRSALVPVTASRVGRSMQLDAVLSSLHRCAIVVFNDDRIITDLWMPGDSLERYGLHRSDLVGRTVGEFLPKMQARVVEPQITSVIETGEHTQFDTSATLPRGDFLFSVSIAPLYDSLGKITGVAGFCIDITESKAAEQESQQQRQVLDIIFHTISDAAWLKDANGRFVIINRAYADLLNSTPEDVVGKSCDDFLPENEAAKIRRTDAEVVRTGKPLHVEQHTWRSAGTLRTFETVKAPVFDESGQVKAIVGISRDVTERIRKNEELERCRDRLERRVAERTTELVRQKASLQAIFDAIPDLVIIVDGRGKVVGVHSGSETHACMTHEEMLHRNLKEILPPQVKADFDKAIGEAHRTNKVVSTTYSLAIEDHTTTYRARFRSYMSDHTIVIVEDITASRQLEDQAREQQERLARIQRANLVGGLATGIAHELNQPLGSIVLYAAMGHKAVADHTQLDRRYLSDLFGKLESLAERCGDIIRNLRRFISQRAVNVSSVNVSDLIDGVLTLANSSLLRAEVDVETSVPPGLMTAVDDVQIQQVLLNLIANAIDAMSSCQPEQRRLVLTVTHSDEWIDISVSDTGVGIPPEHTDRVFDAFFTTKPHGIGMGLAICQNIVQAHGGSIQLIPRGDRGTEARIRLRAAATQPV